MPANFMACTKEKGSTVRTIKRGGKRVVICRRKGSTKWTHGEAHEDKKEKRSEKK